MIIRPFEPEDAEFCFKIRAEAYIVQFRKELDPEIIDECVNAFMPDDYVRMAQEQPLFILTEESERMAFFTFKRVNERVVELPLVFVKLSHLKKDFTGPLRTMSYYALRCMAIINTGQ